MAQTLDLDALRSLARWGGPVDDRLLVVDLDRPGPEPTASDLDALAGLDAVVAGRTVGDLDGRGRPAAAWCDVVVDDAGLDTVADTVAGWPLAATALALVLRGAEGRGLAEGLLVESATYSTLQAGPEFEAWRASRPRRAPEPTDREPVVASRSGDRLTVALSRPTRRNALDAAALDALVRAFEVVDADPTIAQVEVVGEGPAFCAGGDLDEFATFASPAHAHLLRLRRSVGRAMAAVADRVTVHLHGPVAGSGLELAAFAGRLEAEPSTTITLPEVRLGLIPGAGGTWSLPRRIGRHRTAWLGLSGRELDAETAHRWGLVDALVG